jgi:cytidine deaminase
MTDRGEAGLDAGTIERLLAAAREAATRAYVPYSSFPVGAAVLTADGDVIAGVNIENASYGLTVCGERVAILRAASEGHRELRAVAVSAPLAPGTTPCGACRQVMNEFKPRHGEMLVVLDNGARIDPGVVRLSELLPDAFGPHDLKVESGTGH